MIVANKKEIPEMFEYILLPLNLKKLINDITQEWVPDSEWKPSKIVGDEFPKRILICNYLVVEVEKIMQKSKDAIICAIMEEYIYENTPVERIKIEYKDAICEETNGTFELNCSAFLDVCYEDVLGKGFKEYLDKRLDIAERCLVNKLIYKFYKVVYSV